MINAALAIEKDLPNMRITIRFTSITSIPTIRMPQVLNRGPVRGVVFGMPDVVYFVINLGAIVARGNLYDKGTRHSQYRCALELVARGSHASRSQRNPLPSATRQQRRT